MPTDYSVSPFSRTPSYDHTEQPYGRCKVGPICHESDFLADTRTIESVQDGTFGVWVRTVTRYNPLALRILCFTMSTFAPYGIRASTNKVGLPIKEPNVGIALNNDIY